MKKIAGKESKNPAHHEMHYVFSDKRKENEEYWRKLGRMNLVVSVVIGMLCCYVAGGFGARMVSGEKEKGGHNLSCHVCV